MKRTQWAARGMLVVMALFLASCGGSGGGSSSDIPENFNDLAAATNTQSKTLATSIKDFAEKYNAALAFDPSTATGDAIVAPLNSLIASAETLEAALDYYDDLLEAYEAKLAGGGTTSSLSKGLSAYKQSVDPLLIIDIGNLIKQGKEEADVVNALIASGTNEDAAREAYNTYVKTNMANSFNTGVTAIVGGGAGVIAGLAAASAGAPVLVVTGIAVGTGVVVGAIWSWCTSPSQSIGKADSTGGTCALASADGEVVALSNGQNGFAMPLPQGGPGTLCMHVDGKAPLCFSTTIDAAGHTIVTGCFSDGASGTAADADLCKVTTTEESGITVMGADCASVSSVTAAGVASSSGATVTVTVIPPTPGCTVSYTLSGTDGYTQNGTPTTDASGRVVFTVPPGASGVQDTVSLTVTESGAATGTIYTF